jgi:glycolate oxidase subunit GlcD
VSNIPVLDIQKHFEKLLTPEQILSSKSDLIAYGKDWLADFEPNPSLVLLPKTIAEVQEILKVCNDLSLPLVPSGGRTGLSGGATALNKEIILSLQKLNQIKEIDTVGRTISCEAGVTTQQLQEAATAAGLYFPIDFASKGSSHIGGNIATNAGGIRVIRYGNIRDWVLGLKVVCASGELLNLNGALYKNQTGPDLKSLFIGSEGILGVIVEATLKLIKPPNNLIRAIIGLESIKHVMSLVQKIRSRFSSISACEYFTNQALQLVLESNNLRNPLTQSCAHYLLLEIEDEETSLRNSIENFLMLELENDNATDIIVSQNSSQADAFLRYRELIPETISRVATPHKNDISVPVAKITEFVEELKKLMQQLCPEYQVIIFGHVGDGNLHINILKPETIDKKDFFQNCKKLDKEVFELVKNFYGSISAEHGVGLLKKDFLEFSRSKTEIELMRKIKVQLDPKNILNPGKVFD